MLNVQSVGTKTTMNKLWRFVIKNLSVWHGLQSFVRRKVPVNVALLTALSSDLSAFATARAGLRAVGARGQLGGRNTVDVPCWPPLETQPASGSDRCRHGRLTEREGRQLTRLSWRADLVMTGLGWVSLPGRALANAVSLHHRASRDQVNRRCQYVDVMTSRWRHRTVHLPLHTTNRPQSLHDVTNTFYYRQHAACKNLQKKNRFLEEKSRVVPIISEITFRPVKNKQAHKNICFIRPTCIVMP